MNGSIRKRNVPHINVSITRIVLWTDCLGRGHECFLPTIPVVTMRLRIEGLQPDVVAVAETRAPRIVSRLDEANDEEGHPSELHESLGELNTSQI
jgi:hypothetical protein